MEIIDKNFDVHKKQSLAKLQDALTKNNVDSMIISLLEKINFLDSYFTTSSCAGRIVVLQLPEIGDKKNATFLGKWHREVSVSEVLSAIKKRKQGQIWLLSQPPIFHIGCSSLDAAKSLMNIGISCGFKHSGIRSISSQIIVELQSTERVDMPLGDSDGLVVSESSFPFLVRMANDAISRAQKKIKRLDEEIGKPMK